MSTYKILTKNKQVFRDPAGHIQKSESHVSLSRKGFERWDDFKKYFNEIVEDHRVEGYTVTKQDFNEYVCEKEEYEVNHTKKFTIILKLIRFESPQEFI